MDQLNKKEISKTIWIYWDQGEKNAPYIVKECIESWRCKNKEWEVVVLDKSNVDNIIESEVNKNNYSKLSIQTRSDLLRLLLLKKHGGVWVDATVYCFDPLDNWLYSSVSNGFFVFCHPGKDRLISSWFIASIYHNQLIDDACDYFVYLVNEFGFTNSSVLKRSIIKLLSLYFNKNVKNTSLWFHPFILKYLSLYPYFICHYIFNKLIINDTNNTYDIWNKMRKIYAKNSLMVQSISDDSIKSLSQFRLATNNTPVYKFNWKVSESILKKNNIITEIIQSR